MQSTISSLLSPSSRASRDAHRFARASSAVVLHRNHGDKLLRESDGVEGTRIETTDKFLIQTLAVPRSFLDGVKDLSPEAFSEKWEEKWKDAEKMASASRKAKRRGASDGEEGNDATVPNDPFQYKYISAEIVVGKPREAAVGARFREGQRKDRGTTKQVTTEQLYEEFVDLRRSYEENVAESIEHMARQEGLRRRLDAVKRENERLRRDASGKGDSPGKKSKKTPESTSSTTNATTIGPVHVVLTAIVFFLIGNVAASSYGMDIRRW